MSEQDIPDTSFYSYSRWSLRRGADVGRAVELFRDLVTPAYRQVPG